MKKIAELTKEQLIKTLQRLLSADDTLEFLSSLKEKDLERLVSIVRERVEDS